MLNLPTKPQLLCRRCCSSLVVMFLALLASPQSEAVLALDASTSGNFTAILLGGPSDPVADNQANRPDLELVGRPESGLEAFYIGFDNIDSSSTTDGDWFFRVRVSGENGNPDGVLSGLIYVGLDITGDGKLDYLIEHGGNPNQQISILRAGGTAEDTENLSQGTSLFSESVVRFDGSNAATANSFFETVQVIDTNLTGVGYDPYDLDNGGNKDGDLDRFLTFKLDFQDFVDVVRQDAVDEVLGGDYASFDDTFALQMLVATSQNSNNVNSDFGGVDDNDDDAGTPFSDVVTGPIDPGGTEVPEPAGFALWFGVAGLAFLARRRQR